MPKFPGPLSLLFSVTSFICAIFFFIRLPDIDIPNTILLVILVIMAIRSFIKESSE